MIHTEKGKKKLIKLNKLNKQSKDQTIGVVINEPIEENEDLESSYESLNAILSDETLEVNTESLGIGKINERLLKYIEENYELRVKSTIYGYK